MRTILAYGGFRAFAELVRRMHEPEADGVTIEIGHGSTVTLILLRVGDFQVALETEQADAALAGLRDAVREHPELLTPRIEMFGAGLSAALDHVTGAGQTRH